jgi:hypothetical protein
METFMNLGADEIDIRSIKGDFVVHNEKDNVWDKVSAPCPAGGRQALPHGYVRMASSDPSAGDDESVCDTARAWVLTRYSTAAAIF